MSAQFRRPIVVYISIIFLLSNVSVASGSLSCGKSPSTLASYTNFGTKMGKGFSTGSRSLEEEQLERAGIQRFQEKTAFRYISAKKLMSSCGMPIL